MTDTTNHATNALTGWEIDTSTGTPILTYEACSVIQDEQAQLVLRALTTLDALTRELQDARAAADIGERGILAMGAANDEARATIAAQSERIAKLEDALLNTAASLAAAISLLERGGKKAAPSDKMFDMMLADYWKALAGARAALAPKEQQK